MIVQYRCLLLTRALAEFKLWKQHQRGQHVPFQIRPIALTDDYIQEIDVLLSAQADLCANIPIIKLWLLGMTGRGIRYFVSENVEMLFVKRF